MTVNDRNGGGPPGAEERDPRIDRLYRAAERSAPPAHLDAGILAAARREVGARPRPLSSAVRRWRVPVSIAALVVLSVSLVTLVQKEGGEELLQVAPSPPATRSPPEAAAPPATAPAQPRADKPSVAERATRPPVALPAPRDDEGTGARGELGAMPDSARRDAVAGPAASGVGAATAPVPAAKPALQAFPAPRWVEEPEAVSQAAPARDERSLRRQAAQADRSGRLAEAGAPAAEESAKALAGSTPSAAKSQVQASAWQGYEKEPPRKWLERIAELRRQGETATANEMLTEFKRRFPDHPLPADLDRR